MKYLVFAVLSGGHNVSTHSEEIDMGFKDPENEAESIINGICDGDEGMLLNLYEVFVYKSAQNFGDAPVQVAYWNLDDGLFGEQEQEQEQEEG